MWNVLIFGHRFACLFSVSLCFLFSATAEVKKMSKKIEEAESADVPVVADTFVEDAAAGAAELKIHAHKLANWGLKVSWWLLGFLVGCLVVILSAYLFRFVWCPFGCTLSFSLSLSLSLSPLLLLLFWCTRISTWCQSRSYLFVWRQFEPKAARSLHWDKWLIFADLLHHCVETLEVVLVLNYVWSVSLVFLICLFWFFFSSEQLWRVAAHLPRSSPRRDPAKVFKECTDTHSWGKVCNCC